MPDDHRSGISSNFIINKGDLCQKKNVIKACKVANKARVEKVRADNRAARPDEAAGTKNGARVRLPTRDNKVVNKHREEKAKGEVQVRAEKKKNNSSSPVLISEKETLLVGSLFLFTR